MLTVHVRAAHGALLPKGSRLSERQIGNLGESLAYLVTRDHDGSLWTVEATNLFKPLSDESGTGVDLTWFCFDPVDPSLDFAVVQEVKTSTAANPYYSAQLKADVDKLFGDDITLRLQTRLNYWAFKLDVQNPGSGLKARILALGAAAPAQLSQTRLRLTFVHDLAQPRVNLAMERVVKHAVETAHWPTSLVAGWAIGVTELGEALHRCAVV